MAKPRPYILSETTWKTVKSTDYQLAVLPWGATEAHNYHLPYSTDVTQCDAADSRTRLHGGVDRSMASRIRAA